MGKPAIGGTDAGDHPRPSKTGPPEETEKLVMGVLVQVQTLRKIGEVAGDVVGTPEAIGGDADVAPARREEPAHFPQMQQRVIPAQVLDEMRAERQVHDAVGQLIGWGVAEKDGQVGGIGRPGRDLLSRFDRDHMGYAPAQLHGEGAISAADLEETGAGIQEWFE